MNETIDYYNRNADAYYRNTVDADFDRLRRKFVSYLPEHGRIIDIGCGSGRDVKAFRDMGYEAVGLDASTEMARVAREQLGIDVITGDMSEWIAEEPYDGIWCCASLLHLHEEKADRFLSNLKYNLKDNGIILISVKEGIETGIDEKGRYIRNYTEEELVKYIEATGLEVLETENSIEGGYIATKRLITETLPDAIFATSDEIAYGAIDALKDRGLKVPEDVAVTGFGNERMANHVEPKLTTVEIPFRKMGIYGARILFDMIDDSSKEKENRHIMLQARMRIRKSCGHKERIGEMF